MLEKFKKHKETTNEVSANNSTICAEQPKENNDSPLKKKAKAFFKKYFIDAFSGMAQGLFCTLIIGTIIKELGKLICTAGTPAGYDVGNALIMLGSIASMLMGAGIGVGIAKSLKAPNLVMFTAAVAGMIGSYSMNFVNGTYWADIDGMLGLASLKLLPGNPIGAYICTVLAVEVGKKVSGTKIDIILVPFVVSIVALISIYIAWPFVKLVDYIGLGVAKATHVAPAPMGMIIAIVMGILLTLPTSSAAIWIAVATPILGAGSTASPELVYAMQLAGGAAVVGCSCHMVGFAFASYRENGFGGAIAQGIGTSMLQIPNVMRKPRIMIPEIVASFILGPISTCGFKLLCGTSGGGMGTSGFVGVIDTINVSTAAGLDPAIMWSGVIMLLFVLPALISFIVSEIMRHFGWIKFGDQKLEVE